MEAKYKPMEWTWSKIVFVCLLGSVAFYGTREIDWRQAENLIAKPNLDARHYNNILQHEQTSNLKKLSKRSAEGPIKSQLHTTNSQMPALDIALYEPVEATENHEVHKRAIEEQEASRGDKLSTYFYEDYVMVPLNLLDKVKISSGSVTVTMYQQGSAAPPSEPGHLNEVNIIQTEGSDLSRNIITSTGLVKKYAFSDHTYDNDPVRYWNNDESPQVQFLDQLAQSGAKGAYDNLESIIDDLHITKEDKAFLGDYLGMNVEDMTATLSTPRAEEITESISLSLADDGASLDALLESSISLASGPSAFASGQPEPQPVEGNQGRTREELTGIRHIGSELPCLQTKRESLLDGFTARAMSMPVADEPERHGDGAGGNSGVKNPNHEPAGPPIGCCNGRPYSHKKRCCCRRKSYDRESEFCCVSENGCAAFQTFKNTYENRLACEHVGGTIVSNELFGYQSTPMIGWAANVPYGPAYANQAARLQKMDNELIERYNDVLNLHERGRTQGYSSLARGDNKHTDKFSSFRYKELNHMEREAFDQQAADDVMFRTPNARGAYWRDQLASRDFIEDLRADNNMLGSRNEAPLN